MLARLELDRLAPPTLTTLTQAGGALAPALIDRFHRIATARGGRLYVMYGQTEACARIAVLPPTELPARLGAVGVAVPGSQLRVEVDGRAAAPGELGDVVFAGPSVMMGYATDRADLARGDELGGVLATGDRGHLDADGHLWLAGRAGRFAKLFGVRINLDELEALAAAAVPTGGAVAAVAAGDRIRLCVEGAADAAAVRAQIAARTGLHGSGFAVEIVARLPRLPSGKLDYRTLEGG
jgi:acyl-coenzyme A synthetase/AMP-(fatty) acid ligase